jgi:hypothetical protein
LDLRQLFLLCLDEVRFFGIDLFNHVAILTLYFLVVALFLSNNRLLFLFIVARRLVFTVRGFLDCIEVIFMLFFCILTHLLLLRPDFLFNCDVQEGILRGLFCGVVVLDCADGFKIVKQLIIGVSLYLLFLFLLLLVPGNLF